MGKVVITVRPKVKELNFHLFPRSVHPELFNGCAYRVYDRGNYRIAVHITSTGHLLTFSHKNRTLTEISAPANQLLPDGSLLSYTLDSVHQNELSVGNGLLYRCNAQMEGVSPKTFVTIQQQLDDQTTCEGLVHRFQPGGRTAFGAISYVNVQTFESQVRIRSFHTFPDTLAVVKSESRILIEE